MGMQCSTLYVGKRTRSVQKGMRRRAPHDIEIIVAHAAAWVLCVIKRTRCFQNCMPTQSIGTIVS
ncbi:hypothetical protein AO386_09305 [Pseudomonas syringae ICMP 11292]|nr:hypothetical protein AO386_09305 [Pseudomonas syringae ICMP 11292]